MSAKHEPIQMKEGEAFKWKAPSRKTRTWYRSFFCPTCGASTTRNYNRSMGGIVCYGNKQVSPQLSEARAKWREYDDARERTDYHE